MSSDESVPKFWKGLNGYDPSLQHPLGPEAQHPQNPAIRGKVSVNVEYVVIFFDLAKKRGKDYI